MRILVVAPQPFYRERGTPIATRQLVRSLDAAGHRVDVLSYPLGSDTPLGDARHLRSAGVPGIGDVPVGLSWQKILMDVPLVVSLARAATRGAYDVVHAVEEAVFPALLLRNRHRAKVVYDMDSHMSAQIRDNHPLLRPLTPVIEAVEDWAIRESDLVLTVSDELVAYARSQAEAPGRVHALRDTPLSPEPSGQPVTDLRAELPGVSFLGLYVGNLVGYQGIDLLVEAAEHLDGTAGIVVIGGSAGDVDRYRREVERRGLDLTIRFLGPRPVGDLDLYMEQADALLSPRTVGGNTPLKIYSYMASGRPIVATRISSHTQVLGDDHAVLVEPTGESLAEGIASLADDAERRRAIGAAARARAAERYSIAAFEEALTAAYAILAP